MSDTASERAISPLTITLFGPVEALVHGQPLPRLRSRKGYGLLALLVLRHGAEVERAWVAGTLWPESAETQALVSLRSALKDLRQALGPEAERLRSPSPRTLGLDLAGVAADVVAFDAAVARTDAASLAEGVALYRGPLLEGWVEEWAFQERQVREQAYLAALEALADRARERQEWAAAERYLRRAVAADPLREATQRALLEVLAGGGNYAAAVQVYRELRERLHQELNAQPAPETNALFQRIRQEARERVSEGVRERGRDHAEVAPSLTHSLAHSLTPTAAEGTVTFLFTDIEGSTRRWEAAPQRMRTALERHEELLREAITRHGGRIFKATGDGFCAAFATAPEAVAAALAGQRALAAEAWEAVAPADALPEPATRSADRLSPLSVRMAIHTGTAETREGDYVGPPLNRLARLLAAGHGGQVLLSTVAEELARDHLPEAAALRNLGEHRLRDLMRPERIFQLCVPDLPQEFPPLNAVAPRRQNLPLPATPLIGRAQEVAEVRAMLAPAEGVQVFRYSGVQVGTNPDHVAAGPGPNTRTPEPLNTRLVTLTGPGGTGKTRLAVQVAAELEEAFADGVFLVELETLTDASLVISAIAQALELREEAGRSLRVSLTEHLRERHLLLVLDNFERVLDAAPLVAELLAGCPRLKVLATSQARLEIRGETPFVVPPLAVPGASDKSSGLSVKDEGDASTHDAQNLTVNTQHLLQYAAVALFIDRAVAAKPSFMVTNANAPAVAAICARLDGLPLAIELAAARSALFSPEALLQRLENRLRLLTGGARDLPARQQTLRATLSWSYDLLNEGERTLFRRLAVFVGGCTLETAETVCGDFGFWILDFGLGTGEHGNLGAPDRPMAAPPSAIQYPKSKIQSEEVLDLLSALVNRSLLRQVDAEGREPRFVMLETVREYARECLAESGEGEAVRRQHAQHFLALAEEAARELLGAEQASWLDRLESEHDNLRAALDWSVSATERARERGSEGARDGEEQPPAPVPPSLPRSLAPSLLPSPAETALRLGGALWQFWHGRGYLGEGRARIQAALALSGRDAWPRARATALNGAGALAQDQGDFVSARAFHAESLEIATRGDDRENMAMALQNLGNVALEQGRSEEAATLYERALPLWHALGDGPRMARVLNNLGLCAQDQGALAQALAYFEESIALKRTLGDQRGIASSLNNLGMALVEQGAAERAAALLHESLGLFQQLGDSAGVATVLHSLASLKAEHGDAVEAAALYRQGVRLFSQVENRTALAPCLEGLAGVLVLQGQHRAAARFFGAAETLRQLIGVPRSPASQATYERRVAALRATLTESEVAAAWAEGSKMSLARAVAAAQVES